jgi:peptide/nickel transport system permease protein
MTALTLDLPRQAVSRRIHPLAVGLTILAVITLAGIFAPWVGGHDPLAQNAQNPLADPSTRHWLGTDQLGRDVWARLIFSIRLDLPVAIGAVVAPFAIGTIVGLLSGYFGGFTGALLARIGDVVLAFPFVVLVIGLVFVFGSGTTSVLIAFTAIGWVSYMFLARGQVLSERDREYVLAARVLGYSRTRILFRHLLPNVITQGIVYAMSDMVMTIVSIVELGYLGLGIHPPTPEWGSMLSDGTPFLFTHWWLAAAPGVAVVITAIALSLIGDGLADVLRRAD